MSSLRCLRPLRRVSIDVLGGRLTRISRDSRWYRFIMWERAFFWVDGCENCEGLLMLINNRLSGAEALGGGPAASETPAFAFMRRK